MDLATMLDKKRIVVCAGSGGVGKTTTSAAIAMAMAARGGRVAVLTIDPAKRLADALGVGELDNTLRKIDRRRFTSHGVEMRGELWAAMLDMKTNADGLIARLAPDAETRDRIFENKLYQQLSNSIAGTHEYMAMEKVLEMYNSGEFDLVVVDTPPTRNAIDFLTAPARMAQFLEGEALRFFMSPGRLGLSLVGRGGGVLFQVLKRVTGMDVLGDIAGFLKAAEPLLTGFRERARAIEALLGGKDATFLLVCSPQDEPVDEALFFRGRLREKKLPFGGVIVNRVNPDYRYLRADFDGLVDEAVALKVRENLTRLKALGRRDAHSIERLERAVSRDRVMRVPMFGHDIHSVEGLARVADHLFAGDMASIAVAA